MTVVNQGGMGVVSVRHHGGAQHANRKYCALGSAQSRHQPGYGLAWVGRRGDQTRQETDSDDGQHPDDDALKGALTTTVLQKEQSSRYGRRDQRSRHQGQTEEQVERNRASNDLSQIGSNGDQLGLDPVADSR